MMQSQEVSHRVWQGLHMSPRRVAPSPRAKLCTYFRWFARPRDRVLVKPYHHFGNAHVHHKARVAVSFQDELTFVAG